MVRAGSLTAAAQQLHIAQPTLTKTIQSLEQELGARLFERLSRGVALTEAGQVLKRHAERIGVQMTEALGELTALEGGTQGPIAIGAGMSLGGPDGFARVLSAFFGIFVLFAVYRLIFHPRRT